MNSIEKRERSRWESNPSTVFSSQDIIDENSNYLYENGVIKFTDNNDNVHKVGFMVGPNAYSVIYQNKVGTKKTTSGNHLYYSGVYPGQLSISSYLIDTADLPERLVLIDNIAKNATDCKNDEGYHSVLSCSIDIEGVEYFGEISSFSYEKSSSQQFLYQFSLSFVFYNVRTTVPDLSATDVENTLSDEGVVLSESDYFNIKDTSKQGFSTDDTQSSENSTIEEDATFTSKINAHAQIKLTKGTAIYNVNPSNGNIKGMFYIVPVKMKTNKKTTDKYISVVEGKTYILINTTDSEGNLPSECKIYSKKYLDVENYYPPQENPHKIVEDLQKNASKRIVSEQKSSSDSVFIVDKKYVDFA